MTLLRTSITLLACLAFGALLGPPGHAQPAPASRFPFADTTLLRDTLNLRFDRLFELADSLHVRADTLREISIRYGYPLPRLVLLADSLHVPVDSIGAVLLRARFNPLATRAERLTSFRYGSTYNIAQTSGVWGNTASYNYVLGSLFVQNTTDISMDRRRAGGGLGLRQTRSSTTEAGWKFSPDFSVGGRANLSRFNNRSTSGGSRDAETKNEYQVSVRNRLAPARNLESEFNFFTGLLDVRNARQEKRGISSDLSGNIHYARSGWLSHDLDGQVTGNVSRSNSPGTLEKLNTRDFSTNLRGALGLFSGSNVSGNAGYYFRRVRVESPAATGGVERIRTNDNGVNATLRLRLDNNRFVNLDQSIAGTRQASAQSLAEQTTRRDRTITVNGAYAWRAWTLTGRFSNGNTTTEYPVRDTSGGYREKAHPRVIEATITRSLGRRVTLVGTGGVTLSSLRYEIIRNYASPPVSRDQYRQYYRIDGTYSRNVKSTTGVTLEVSRSLDINLPSASTAANSERRSYRAEWRWSYQLLKGMTATQRNQITADYVDFNFVPDNNRLSLDYNSITTLNAVITPRLRVDLTHITRRQPSGNYRPLDAGGTEYFSRADENRNLGLTSSISYTPTPALSLNLQTDYFGNDREGTADGQTIPQRTNRTLNFTSGANVNLPLGPKGSVTGNINRSYRADRSITYQRGVPQPNPSSRTDYWNGRLAFSWEL